MNILALDNACDTATVGLWMENAMVLDRHFFSGRGEGGVFFSTIREALTLCPSPHHIVVGLGPGSYSGLRVAIATAYGLELATEAALTGLPSIASLAVPESRYRVVGDVRRGSYFSALIEDGALASPIALINREELDQLLESSASKFYSLDTNPLDPRVNAARVSAEKLCRNVLENPPLLPNETLLQPLYLKPVHITKKEVKTGA